MRHDLVIVGGGIVGTSLAYFAVKAQPQWSVALVEQAEIGGGASAASAGFDAVESPNAKLRELAIRSRLLYRLMAHDVPAARVRRLRTLWVVSEHQALSFAEHFKGHTGDYSKLRQCDRSVLPDGFSRERGNCVFEDDEDGHADVRAICRGIVHHLGANHPPFSFSEGARVTSVERQGDSCVVFLSDGRKLQSRCVAVATGAWLLGGHLDLFGRAAAPLRVKKIASLRLGQRPQPTSPAVVYGEQGAFFMPRIESGDWLFSFTLDAWDCVPSGEMRLLPNELAQGLAQLEALAPGMREAVCGEQVFCDVYTPDRVPLQSAAGVPHVLVLTGFSGAGYRTAPAVAEDALNTLIDCHNTLTN